MLRAELDEMREGLGRLMELLMSCLRDLEWELDRHLGYGARINPPIGDFTWLGC